MPTTVLVDAWHLGGFSANRGIGTYLRNVLAHLATRHDLEIVALTTNPSKLPEGVTPWPIRRRAPNRFAQREHDAMLPRDLARAIRGVKADVVLSPADNPPRRVPVPWVQMLHDLIPLAVSDPAFTGTARRWRRIGPRLRDASAVITNSRQTARDATRLLGVEQARLHVAPLGVGRQFHPPAQRRADRVRRLLYVGEYGPHKGYPEAFAVIDALADRGFPHRLEVTGLLPPWHETQVRTMLASAAHPERVDLLGYVDDIVDHYQRADALVVTSRYEGFCLPALEAMACGTPVVAFANSAIVEVVEGGGTLVVDGDVTAMADALEALLCDSVAWREASESALRRASRFGWDRCASVHADVLIDVASSE